MTNNDQAESPAASIAPADLPESAFTDLTRTPLTRTSLHTTEDGECLVRARFTMLNFDAEIEEDADLEAISRRIPRILHATPHASEKGGVVSLRVERTSYGTPILVETRQVRHPNDSLLGFTARLIAFGHTHSTAGCTLEYGACREANDVRADREGIARAITEEKRERDERAAVAALSPGQHLDLIRTGRFDRVTVVGRPDGRLNVQLTVDLGEDEDGPAGADDMYLASFAAEDWAKALDGFGHGLSASASKRGTALLTQSILGEDDLEGAHALLDDSDLAQMLGSGEIMILTVLGRISEDESARLASRLREARYQRVLEQRKQALLDWIIEAAPVGTDLPKLHIETLTGMLADAVQAERDLPL